MTTVVHLEGERPEGTASLTERNTESDDSSTLGDTRTKIEARRVASTD